MNIEGLDKLDRAILEMIKDHARMSYSDIGEKVGLSRVAVKNRMEILEKKGIIQGYKTIIDETKVPEGISFILDVETNPEAYQDVVEVLAKDRFIRQIYSVTGECRIHCAGFAPNSRTLDSHVNYLFRNTKGIRKMNWNMLLRTIKDVDGGVEYDGCKKSEYLENGREAESGE